MPNKNTQHEFYVRCPFGLEKTTAQELANLQIRGLRPLKGGVAFFGSLEQAYTACLWLRCASRVLLVLSRFAAADADALYAGIKEVEWSEHLSPEATFAIHARGVNNHLKNTQFTALRAKDALCDYFSERQGKRPDVQQKRPDVQLEVALRENKATLYLDLSGEPLHRRGYRIQGEQSAAPLKENLAAGILLKSGWCTSRLPEDILLDPLCGSGTLVIEGAMIAADRAPGLLRQYWGFTGWRGHQAELWNTLLEEAHARFKAGKTDMPYLIGSDIDSHDLALAKQNAERAGLGNYLYFGESDVAQIKSLVSQALHVLAQRDGKQPADIEVLENGVVVTNPPYAQRMFSHTELHVLYKHLRQGLESLPPSWHANIITSDSSIDTHLGILPFQTEVLYNGKIETTLRQYHLDDTNRHRIEITSPQDGSLVTISTFDKGSDQFAARLKKVYRERRKWAKREGISCYRIYDADLPDYSVAIDRYEGVYGSTDEVFACIAEYRAPQEIDVQKAQRRFHDVLSIVPVVMGIPEDRIITKVRERAKGGGQYSGLDEAASTTMTVKEGGLSFEVQLSGYLDTGLFLDGRITRELLREKARGRDFLNLFAYTATATVYAAAGGARSTTTVDLSNTYLSWAKRNMGMNGFTGSEHNMIRADVLDWLKRQKDTQNLYDLIFVDPPTFSNSKSMGAATWSVQRDHVSLLQDVITLLRPGGEAVFSCNLRNFKPNLDALSQAGISLEDITTQTIPEDFSRNRKIHRCYIVRAQGERA